jgi:hypothetical protein
LRPTSDPTSGFLIIRFFFSTLSPRHAMSSKLRIATSPRTRDVTLPPLGVTQPNLKRSTSEVDFLDEDSPRPSFPSRAVARPGQRPNKKRSYIRAPSNMWIFFQHITSVQAWLASVSECSCCLCGSVFNKRKVLKLRPFDMISIVRLMVMNHLTDIPGTLESNRSLEFKHKIHDNCHRKLAYHTEAFLQKGNPVSGHCCSECKSGIFLFGCMDKC